MHFSSLLIFIQTYSFDLQRPPPPNNLRETTGTFEPVYLDDLGECGYIHMTSLWLDIWGFLDLFFVCYISDLSTAHDKETVDDGSPPGVANGTTPQSEERASTGENGTLHAASKYLIFEITEADNMKSKSKTTSWSVGTVFHPQQLQTNSQIPPVSQWVTPQRTRHPPNWTAPTCSWMLLGMNSRMETTTTTRVSLPFPFFYLLPKTRTFWLSVVEDEFWDDAEMVVWIYTV